MQGWLSASPQYGSEIVLLLIGMEFVILVCVLVDAWTAQVSHQAPLMHVEPGSHQCNNSRLIRTQGQVNQISNVLLAVSETLHRASQLHREVLEATSAASERSAKSLAAATWALMGATVALVVVPAIHAYIAFQGAH